MANNQNSIQYFSLQDWWGSLTETDRKILDEVYKQKSASGKSLLSAPRERYMDVGFLSDLLISVNKNPELQVKIVDKLMERYAGMPAPDDLVDDALVELHHAQIRVMNYFYGQRNYASQALDMALRVAQDNVNIEARVLRVKRERIKRAAYRKASQLEEKAQAAGRKGDLISASKLHLEAREKRQEGAFESCAYSEEHPCFRQMAIIAEKNDDHSLAHRIAVDARSAGWIDRNDDWTRRINRLAKKNGATSDDSGPFDGYLGVFNLTGFFRKEFSPQEQELIINELTAKHPLIDGYLEPDGHTARTALVRLAETVAEVVSDEAAVAAHLDAIQKQMDRYPGDAEGDTWERHLTFGRNALACLAAVQGRTKPHWSWSRDLEPMQMATWYATSAISFEGAARREFDAHYSDNPDAMPTHPARTAVLLVSETLGFDDSIEPVAEESRDDGWAGPWDAVLARHRS